ncbi:MAG: hypothetical protein E6J41_31825 [Chloroflexi bacterium]|nr:MAG: hypothetical protein E6J41_31825 [Chloroflexota bacterium]
MSNPLDELWGQFPSGYVYEADEQGLTVALSPLLEWLPGLVAHARLPVEVAERPLQEFALRRDLTLSRDREHVTYAISAVARVFQAYWTVPRPRPTGGARDLRQLARGSPDPPNEFWRGVHGVVVEGMGRAGYRYLPRDAPERAMPVPGLRFARTNPDRVPTYEEVVFFAEELM